MFLTSFGAKTICDRLEPNYVICEQDELRIDRLIRQEKTSFRLIDAVIKQKISNSIYKIRNSKQQHKILEHNYHLYLKTDTDLILYDYYTYLPHAEDRSEIIINYIKDNPNPKYYLLNIRNNILEIYPQSKYFHVNIIILILGWIMLIVIIRPIFKKINQSTLNKKYEL